MRKVSVRWAGVHAVALAFVFALANTAWGDAAAEARDELRAAEAALLQIAERLRAEQYEEAAEQVRETLTLRNRLAARAEEVDVDGAVASLDRRLAAAGRLLASRGMTIEGLDLSVGLPTLPEPVGRAPQSSDPPPESPTGFTRAVAPILIGKCAGCHIAKSSGGLSMANFTALMKGSESGRIVIAGDAPGSRLVEVLETGDMPRGGDALSFQELAAIRRWIADGAKFDGADVNASLLPSVTPSPNTPRAAMNAVARGDGVSFSVEIAPILLEHCIDCHGGANPRAGLSMANFQRLLAGGDGGAVLVAGAGSGSRIVGKLKGTADGARMPMGRPPLDDALIARVETWIDQGAVYDGVDPTLGLAEVMNRALAGQLDHEQLASRRAELAQRDWRLALPDVTPAVFDTENFHLVGNVTPVVLEEVARAAEVVQTDVAKRLRVSGRPFVKGKITLYVFRRRYDYAEFGQMVEERQLPAAWRGHWRYNALNAYACLVPPGEGDDYSLDALLAAQTAGVYLDSLGELPRWFAQGAAHWTAWLIDRGDPRFRAWDDQLAAAVRAAPNADAFVDSDAATGNMAIASYGFVRHGLAARGRIYRLLAELREGTDFDRALFNTYGADAKTLFTAFAAQAR